MYHCIEHCLSVYTPHEKVSSDSKSLLIPGLPDKTEMKRSQLPENIIKTNPEGPYWEMLKKIKESEHRSYAMIHDTIYDLESSYAELYQTIKEQFYNEKLVEILGCGVGVGQKYGTFHLTSRIQLSRRRR
ncbi:hypothetical protein BC332_30994 [Capsicum chinense]|nr:hypothetical protein BC332_30994 [Capsicum chinense]